MPLGVIAAATIGSTLIGGLASEHAAKTQADAANQAAAQQMQMFNTINQQQAPYREAGYGALKSIAGMGDYFNKPMTPTDLTNYLSPSYNFMLQQGLGQVRNQANAVGGLVGGNALQGLNTFAQNYALNAGQTAFENYQAQQQNIFNRLASIAGIGQTSTGQTAGAAVPLAQASSNFLTSGAAAQAAGTVGAANALSGGLQNLGSWYAFNNMGGLGGGGGGGFGGAYPTAAPSDPYGLGAATVPTY